MKKIFFSLVFSITLILTGVLLISSAEVESSSEEAGSGELIINSNASDPAPKAAWEQVVNAFQAAYPDIDVQFNTFDHEAYKTNIRNFLVSSPPDIALWFAGNRMKFFVDQGLLEDVSDVWEEAGLKESMASTLSVMTIDGKQYGVPYGYYQWGVYYRKDIFDQYGLSVPTTWDEFLAVCATLKSNGITPISIGTKFLWTAAGWFDYLNLRINGLDYHLSLTDGDASYLDSELDQVFDEWAKLVDNGYYLENHATYSWQEAQAPLINGSAAMYLIGNFIVPDLDSAGVVDNIGFFQFPKINPDLPFYEDAPTDTAHIPSGAKNKANARLFLKFFADPSNIGTIAEAIGNLSPSKDSPAPSDRFLQAGSAMLADAAGVAQFYDRDTTPEMASKGMEQFQRFMVDTSIEQEARQIMDAERKRIFGK